MRIGQFDCRLGGKPARDKSIRLRPNQGQYNERCACGAPLQSEQAWENRECDDCHSDRVKS